jgi:hypothetical protein
MVAAWRCVCAASGSFVTAVRGDELGLRTRIDARFVGNPVDGGLDDLARSVSAALDAARADQHDRGNRERSAGADPDARDPRSCLH